MLYLDKEEHWDELVNRACAAGAIGLDTEFHGVNIGKQSCVGRAVVHVWSVALATANLDPLGFHRARGWVLPAAALQYPPLVTLLGDPGVRKYVHNQSVDHHALANAGVRLRGAVDTLNLIRWARPELIRQPGRFKLKSLMNTLLRRDPVCTYKELVGDTRPVSVTRLRRVKCTECSCGVRGCRLRRDHVKTRRVDLVEVTEEKVEHFEHPLSSIVPGHPRWDLLLRYAADDAVAALEIADVARRAADPAPWPYTPGTRPAYNQEVTDAVVDMETVGIRVDLDYCTTRLAEANADEVADLNWLHRWYVANAPTFGPHRFEDTVAVWSSHPQKLALFDALEFPHSPVWKKGLVKRGDIKLDGVAQAWIGKNYSPSAQLMAKLLHLQRVRAGKKYLQKLLVSDGTIHPICGPASDSDERAGAVTGRLGIKGELEAQQLPSREEVDFYGAKRAIVAPTGAVGGKTSWRTFLQVHDSLALSRPGYPIVEADYSALEVVILADLCLRLFGDDQIARMVAPGAPDIHGVNAREIFGRHLGWTIPTGRGFAGEGQSVLTLSVDEFKTHPFGKKLRHDTKITFYGLAYRKGAYGFQVLEDVDGMMIGEMRAQEMLDAFALAMPGVFTWHRYVSEQTRRHGGIYSLDGRWCDLRDKFDDGTPEWIRSRGDRQATNFPMQATGAGIIGDAMTRVRRCRELAAPETETDRAVALLKHHMESSTANGTRLLIPLQVTVGIGPNLKECK